MKFIVAVDANWGIGRDGGMLDHLPKDLAFFKEKTMGHVVVMGRKTLESFPGGRPLANRVNIVLTTRSDYTAPKGAVCVHSLAELAEQLERLGREDVFLIGGGQVYQSLLPACNGGYVTHIDHAYDEVQVFFPNLDHNEEWQLTETIGTAEDKQPLRFCYYQHLNPKKLEDLI